MQPRKGLEGLPLSWEPGTWALATNYPHLLLLDRTQLLREAAGGAAALALFVSQL